MAVEIGALRALLSLDSAAFESGVKRAQGSTKRLSDTMKQVAKVAATAFAAVTAAAIAGARDIDQVAKASRRIGSSIGGFEALKLAAGEAGVPLSSLPDELQNINREIANIGTSGNADRALERLGLAASDLANLDADEKIARIADRVRELGLSSGEATALLRDLGVRNREMVLLLQQGGGAIRAARVDVEDYGLALSGPVVAAIEQANDRIGRLSIVARVFGQQLATAVVPTLGRFSEAITDSLREGGLLRDAIDVITSAIRGLVVVVEAVVDGLRMLADWMGEKAVIAVGLLSAALVILRRNMIRTGILALIVAAGSLIDFLDRLVTATGSWGDALSALGDLASGVWEGIKTSASSIGPALGAVWQDVKASFFILMENLSARWRDFLLLIGGAVSAIPGADGIAGGILDAAAKADAGVTGFMRSANDAEAAAAGLRAEAASLATAGFDKAREAAAKLSEILNGEKDATTEAAEEAKKLSAALDDIGGGKAKKAADGLKETEKAARDLAAQNERTSDSFARMFVGILDGSQKASEALRRIGLNLLESGISGLLQNSGIFSGGLGDLFSGFFDSGGMIPAGQFGIVGERGPEIVTGPARVTSRADTARMMQGGGQAARIEVVARVEGGNITQHVQQVAGNVAVQVMSEGLADYDRNQLPGSVDRINSDPRRRG